jgi:hypothetical protein
VQDEHLGGIHRPLNQQDRPPLGVAVGAALLAAAELEMTVRGELARLRSASAADDDQTHISLNEMASHSSGTPHEGMLDALRELNLSDRLAQSIAAALERRTRLVRQPEVELKLTGAGQQDAPAIEVLGQLARDCTRLTRELQATTGAVESAPQAVTLVRVDRSPVAVAAERLEEMIAAVGARGQDRR